MVFTDEELELSNLRPIELIPINPANILPIPLAVSHRWDTVPQFNSDQDHMTRCMCCSRTTAMFLGEATWKPSESLGEFASVEPVDNHGVEFRAFLRYRPDPPGTLYFRSRPGRGFAPSALPDVFNKAIPGTVYYRTLPGPDLKLDPVYYIPSACEVPEEGPERFLMVGLDKNGNELASGSMTDVDVSGALMSPDNVSPGAKYRIYLSPYRYNRLMHPLRLDVTGWKDGEFRMIG